MSLKTITTAELQAELARRQRATHGLAERRERLARELAAVESELALLTGQRRPRVEAAPPGARPARAHNERSLPDALAAAVAPGRVVSPQEAAELVRQAGYASGARTFGMMVATALAKDARFRRLARGRYERTG